MRITELRLKSADLAAQRAFYADALGLPVIAAESHHLMLQIGPSRMVFEYEPDFSGRYHFAFEVPENQIAMARDWVNARTPLIPLDGQTIFHSPGWNAHMLYFTDPAGNVLECIARHNQSTTSNAPFSAASLLSISEIGLGVPDVRGTVTALGEGLGLAVYDGAGSDQFSAVGDETGLFIVARSGRIWYPQSGVPAGPHPVTAHVEGNRAARWSLAGLPFSITMNQ